MKVLMLSSDRKAFEDGSAVRNRLKEYAHALTSQRHRGSELDVIVMSNKSLGFVPVQDGPLHIYPTNHATKVGALFAAYRIGKRIKDVAVVSSQDPFEMGLVGWRLAKRQGARLQVQVHTDFLSPHFSTLSLLNRLRVAIARIVLRRADSIRVVSKKIADEIDRWHLRAPVRVLPIYTDLEALWSGQGGIDVKKSYPQFKNRVLVVARLEKEKGLDLAVHAFALLPKDTGLFIVGEGSQRAPLEALAQTLRVADRVFFLGWQKSLTALYESADVLLSTSFYEGYGLALAEAAALGCPIVSSNVGIATELRNLGARIAVVDTRDPAQLSEALSDMFEQGRVLAGDFILGLTGFSASKEQYLKHYIDLLTA